MLANSAAAGFTNVFSEGDINKTIAECTFDLVVRKCSNSLIQSSAFSVNTERPIFFYRKSVKEKFAPQMKRFRCVK